MSGTTISGIPATAATLNDADWLEIEQGGVSKKAPASLVVSATANYVVSTLDTTTLATAAQGAKADTAVQPGDLAAVATSGSATDLIAGTLPAARMPEPTVSTLGGVMALAAATNEFLTGIGADGVPTAAQPTASNISGLAAVASSGAYGDLSGTPTLGTAAAQDTTAFEPAAAAPRVITASSPITVGASDLLILINQTSPAALTITLPDPATKVGPVIIKDWAGVAGAYNFTISGATIDGQSSFVMNANFQSLGLRPVPGLGYAIT